MDSISKNNDSETNQLTKIIDGITAIAIASKSDYALSANRVLKGLIAKDFFDALKNEWNNLAEQGKIKSDYENSKNYIASLTEISAYLDNDIPDKDILDALKRLFFISAANKEDNSQDILAIEYIRIIKKLNSGELVLLFTTYQLIDEFKDSKITSADIWRKTLAERTGLFYPELVDNHEEKLVKLNVITKRHHIDESGVNITPHFRLTDFGYNLCKYVNNYDEITKV